MAISYVGSGSVVTASSGTLVINAPAGAQAGDVLFFILETAAAPSSTTHFLLVNSTDLYIYYVVVVNAGSLAASYGVSTQSKGVCIAYRGATKGLPTQDAVSTSAGATLLACPTVGLSYTGDYIVTAFGSNATASTLSVSTAGTTTRVTSSPDGTNRGLIVADRAPGSTSGGYFVNGSSTTTNLISGASLLLQEDGSPYLIGSRVTKASSTLSISPAITVQAGETVFVTVVTNAAPTGLSLTDGLNSYSLVSSIPINNTTANGTIYVFASYQIANPITSGNSITVSVTSGTTLMAMSVAGIGNNVTAAKLVTPAQTAFGSSTVIAVTKSGLTTTNNYIGLEFGAWAGLSTDFSSFNSTSNRLSIIGTTGGSTASNRALQNNYLRLTGATSYSDSGNLSTARAWGNIALVYQLGNTVIGSLTESGTSSDAIDPTVIVAIPSFATEASIVIDGYDAAEVAYGALTESGAGDDSIDNTALLNSSRTEVGSSAATMTAVEVNFSGITNAVTANDSQVGGAAIISDLLEVLDSIEGSSYTVTLPVGLIEASLADATADNIASLVSRITEVASATHQNTGSLLGVVDRAENGSAVTTGAAQYAVYMDADELVDPSDSTKNTIVAQVAQSEDQNILDEATSSFLVNGLKAETVTATESLVYRIGVLYTANSDEAGILEDATDTILLAVASNVEVGNTSDYIEAIANFVLTIDEAANTSDEHTNTIITDVSVDENSAAIETIYVDASFVSSIDEPVVVDEIFSGIATKLAYAQENNQAGDLHTVNYVIYNVTVGEPSVARDAMASTGIYALTGIAPGLVSGSGGLIKVQVISIHAAQNGQMLAKVKEFQISAQVDVLDDAAMTSADPDAIGMDATALEISMDATPGYIQMKAELVYIQVGEVQWTF